MFTLYIRHRPDVANYSSVIPPGMEESSYREIKKALPSVALDSAVHGGMTDGTMTAEQVKQQFEDRGETFTAWAKKNNFELYLVYRVLNGQSKARFGKGHQIAAALGLKNNSNN